MLTDKILELVGNNPLLQLKGENIFAKTEFSIPAGVLRKAQLWRQMGRWAVCRLSENIEGNIATILPDRADRYFSTALL